MADVVMPRLSDSMEEGTILRWLKADGDRVVRGEEIVEIETDKATMLYASDADGVLAIVAPEGETLPIGTLIATLDGGGSTGEDASAAGRAASRIARPGGVAPAPAAPSPASVPASPPPPEPAPAPAHAPSDTPARPGAQDERVRASPLARRMARELGIELKSVQGTGPGGRVVKADVEAVAATPGRAFSEAGARPGVAAGAATPASDVVGAKGVVEVEELTRTQQTIARRMAEARATVPDFLVSIEIDMDAAVALRVQWRAAVELREGERVAPSLNDLVIKACGLALREHPRVNGAYRDGHFELYERINVGVAVAAENALVVPVVPDADRRSLEDIALATRTLAERVRTQQITPPELAGATFTVSNLGMFGIHSFTAVINPPQAAILAVGAVEPRPVVRDGEVVVRQMLTATMASDHRILYGADAARFLGRVRELLEQPVALTL